MLQLVYISSAVEAKGTAAILAASRRNNGRDQITGLLYADGVRFLQALEGPEEMVETAFARIKADPRHRAIVILSRRHIEAREFGPWEMAQRAPGDEGDSFVRRVERLVAKASPGVRGTFDGFVQVRRAA